MFVNDVDLIKEYVSLIVEGIKGRFDMHKFKSLKFGYELEDYASKHLKKLGYGSARSAFVLSSRSVLKVARNEKGLAQNEAEVSVYTNPITKPIVTKIFDFDHKDYSWVVAEIVKPFSDDDSPWRTSNFGGSKDKISDIIGLKKIKDYDGTERQMTFRQFLRHAYNGNFYEFENQPESIIEFAKAVHSLRKNYLEFADIEHISHWGLTSDGRVVILDYGFTSSVAEQFY